MKVLLRKDIVGVGMKGSIIKVSDGYGRNYVIPNGLGIEVTPETEGFYAQSEQVNKRKKEVVESQTSMLAERIKSLQLTLKRKMHDDGKLYGAVNAGEVVDLLAEKGIKISKSQVEFTKKIQEKGNFEVTIVLSTRLKPTLTLKVIPEKQQQAS